MYNNIVILFYHENVSIVLSRNYLMDYKGNPS